MNKKSKMFVCEVGKNVALGTDENLKILIYHKCAFVIYEDFQVFCVLNIPCLPLHKLDAVNINLNCYDSYY